MMPKFEARRALQLIQEYKIQSTYMPPVLLKRMLAVPPEVFKQYDVSSLKCITVGGAPCPMSTKIAINKMFGPVYYEFYGSTELGINSVLRPEVCLIAAPSWLRARVLTRMWSASTARAARCSRASRWVSSTTNLSGSAPIRRASSM